MIKCAEMHGRDDHVIKSTLHLPHAVFSFSEKLSSFPLALQARIILRYKLIARYIMAAILVVRNNKFFFLWELTSILMPTM